MTGARIKKVMLLVILPFGMLLSLTPTSLAQGWVQQTSGISNTLEGVFFTSRDTGIIVGSSGVMLRTTNGGATWALQSSGTTQTLHWVAFRTPLVGDVVGDNGVIRHTTDGGTTWTPQTSGTTKALYEIFYNGPNTATAVGEDGKILRTTNGGATWTSQSSGTPQTLYGVFFSDSARGTAVGGNGAIRLTTNGGATWTSQPSGTSNILFEVCFFNTDTGVAVGSNGTIIRTTNGGVTWISQASGTSQTLLGLKFVDNNIGFAVGTGGTILRTTNGGVTWTSQSSGTTAILFEVHFTDANTGTAVGSSGTILRTTTGGETGVPQFSVSPTVVDFGDVVTSTSGQDSVTVTNTGSSTLTISSVTSDNGEFSVTPTGASITPSASQRFYITFSPANSGAESGNIVFAHDATTSPDTVGVSGTGVAPGFSVAPTSVAFGDVVAGSSKQDSVTVTNTGTSTLTISSAMSDNGEFSVTPSNGSIVPSASQRFYIAFNPADAGLESGNIVFVHDAIEDAMITSDTVTVTGTGVEPGFSVAQTVISFGNVVVASSKQDSVAVTNTGTSTLTINSIASDNAEFSVTPSSASITPSASQKLYITFSPTNSGAESGNIVFTHDASSSPDTVTVSGTGVEPVFSVVPLSVTFGDVVVASSKQDSVTVTNTGTSTLAIISAVSDNGEFSVTPSSGSISPSSSMKFFITFGPANRGAEAGNIVFTHDASGSPDTVEVNGTGVEPGFSVAQANIAFGNVVLGSSKQDSVTVTNTGTSTLNISSVASDNGEFSVTPSNGSIPSSSSQKFYVTFSPVNSGPESGNIVFTHDASSSPDTIEVSGTGVEPGFSVAPTSLAFGNVVVGMFKQDSVIVTNTGTSTLTISSVASDNAEFSVTPSSGSLAPSSSQKFYITFSPNDAGAESGNIIFTHDASSSQDSVAVSGTGIAPGFAIAPTSVAFGDITVGAGKVDSVTVTNTGTLALTISSVLSDNAEFGVTPTSGSVAPLASQKFYITFTPADTGAELGNIIFVHDASGSPDSVAVSGNGLPIEIVTTFLAGWEMISNPVTTAEDSVRQLFPTADMEFAFAFNGVAYELVYRLENRRGYWEKFTNPVNNTITGIPRGVDTIDVTAGWNMVGSISYPVDTGTIVSIPAGIRGSDWIGYVNGYVAVDQINPGKGYWVKANSTGQFVLSRSGSSRPSVTENSDKQRGAANATTSDPLSALSNLTITDGRGQTQTLYFGIDTHGGVSLTRYDMPPVPPVGAFDIRFETREGGSRVRTHPTDEVLLPIRVQAYAYPLTVAWNVRDNSSYVLMDGSGDAAFEPREMRDEGTLRVAGAEVSRLVVKRTGNGPIPESYALHQNYPNPFNPTTTIKFALPVESKVSVEVYNVLGQRVATLVNQVLPGGYHTIEWNGTRREGESLSSGVYFLRLSADGTNGARFNGIRKLLMMK